MSRNDQLYLALTALGTAVICHFLFSPYGFNPTDEGFVLSSSMRLLHGQVPHADLSSLRPLGYAYLHIPELLIGEDHTFLVSRFVYWLELSVIAYIWVLTLLKSSNFEVRSSNYGMGILLFLVTFLFNAHYFPIAVLHTIDGLLFAVLGFYLVMRSEKYSWLGGLFIGYAVLCKQGFAVLLPLLVWLFPQKRAAWLTAFLPGIVYVVYISGMGGWDDLRTQLTAHTELLDVGFLNYVLNPWLFGGAILQVGSRKLRITPLLTVSGLALFQVALLLSGHYHGQGLQLLFGYALADSFAHPARRPLYFLALALAWCVSISVGYASIALFSGGLTALLMLPLLEQASRPTQLVFTGILLFAFFGFVFVRTTHIYRDAPRTQLIYRLDGVVKGAHGIYTNARTFAVLKELDSLQAVHPKLLVLPDFTACQLFDPERPILTEWPNRAEVPNEAILRKVAAPLDAGTDHTVAVARYQAALLADTLLPLDAGDYRVLQNLDIHFQKTDSTRFFRLYSPK